MGNRGGGDGGCGDFHGRVCRHLSGDRGSGFGSDCRFGFWREGADNMVCGIHSVFVCTLFSFVVVRPIAIKMFFHKDKNARKSGVDALIGRVGVVSETIDSAANTGRVSIDGDDWKAVAADGDVIEKGEQVEVLEVNSVVLTVKKK